MADPRRAERHPVGASAHEIPPDYPAGRERGDVDDITLAHGPYQIKDSGKRAEFQGGMVRDTSEGKLRPDLVRDGPMLNRWIIHLTNGAMKYEARNWMKGLGDPAVLERAFESADRHYHQWREGHIDEDHAAAVFFNINQVEYHKLHEKEVAEDASQAERPVSTRYCG